VLRLVLGMTYCSGVGLLIIKRRVMCKGFQLAVAVECAKLGDAHGLECFMFHPARIAAFQKVETSGLMLTPVTRSWSLSPLVTWQLLAADHCEVGMPTDEATAMSVWAEQVRSFNTLFSFP
jgi:hypothetical protein